MKIVLLLTNPLKTNIIYRALRYPVNLISMVRKFRAYEWSNDSKPLRIRTQSRKFITDHELYRTFIMYVTLEQYE